MEHDYVQNVQGRIENMSKKGSITVEASLIVPVILIILFLFIYVIFAVHDRAILLMKVDNLLENIDDNLLNQDQKTLVEIFKSVCVNSDSSFDLSRL